MLKESIFNLCKTKLQDYESKFTFINSIPKTLQDLFHLIQIHPNCFSTSFIIHNTSAGKSFQRKAISTSYFSGIGQNEIKDIDLKSLQEKSERFRQFFDDYWYLKVNVEGDLDYSLPQRYLLVLKNLNESTPTTIAFTSLLKMISPMLTERTAILNDALFQNPGEELKKRIIVEEKAIAIKNLRKTKHKLDKEINPLLDFYALLIQALEGFKKEVQESHHTNM